MNENDQDKYPTMKTLTETLPAPIVDEASTTVSYFGWSSLGTKTTDAKWKIARVTKASATTPYGVVITEYADGDMNYDNIWNNRASLNYSR